jgi:Leucine-rich repeat (LRR) protein
MLEYLELGKNFISNMDHLVNNPSNRFCFLTELYLYSNQLTSIPHNLSYMQLKVLNLNRNQDLTLFSLGYCPLLESLSLSYCSFNQLKSLVGAPNLRDLDLSFNSI